MSESAAGDGSAAPPAQELARWQSDVRLRALGRRPPPPTRLPVLAWMAAGAATVLLAWLWYALIPAPRPAARDSIRIVLLNPEPPPAPEPPLPQPAPRMPAPRVAPISPANRDAVAAPRAAAGADADAAVDTAPPHVFNADGSIALPPEPAAPRSDALVATFAAPPRSAESVRIMTHQRPLKVRPNHFAAHFRAQSGSALTDFVEDNLTVSKSFTLPWGTHVDCKGVGLGVAWLGVCGWYTPYKYYVPQAPWRPASVLDEQ